MAKYGTVWQHIDVTRISALMYSFVYFVRRYLLAVLIGYTSQEAFQVHVISASSLLLLIYVWHIKPMEGQVHNRISRVNEVTMYVASWVLFFFTKNVDVRIRWVFGYVFIFFAETCIVLNLMLVMRVAFRWIRRQQRKKAARKWEEHWKQELKMNPVYSKQFSKPKPVFKPTLPFNRRNKIAAAVERAEKRK